MNNFFNPPANVRLLDLEQRTPQWHAWRDGRDLPDGKPRITATMAAIIAGDSVTKSTPTQLWGELTGRIKPSEPSDFLAKLFARGTKMEPEARAAYEDFTGNEVQDTCVQHPDHPWAAASLDGLSPSADLILEIKCPVSARVHAEAKAGRIPSHYIAQLRWQLLCVPAAREAHFWSWFPDDDSGQPGALVTLQRDAAAEAQLLAQCLRFRSCLVDDTPPVEDAFKAAAMAYRKARAEADYAEAQLQQADAALKVALADQDLAEACGVRLTRYSVRGVVDYAKALVALGLPAEQLALSLEGYRKAAPIDYEAAWKGLSAASSLDDTSLRQIEAKYTGESHTRHRLTLDKYWTPAPADLVTAQLEADVSTADTDWNW